MNVMITGVNGFIGKNLCNYLTNKEINVFGIDNFYSSKRSDLKKINSKHLYFLEASILDKNILKKAPFKIDSVIHLAAQTSVMKSIKKPKENDQINVDGFKNIINQSFNQKIKKFIFCSSCAVYGDSSKLPCKENVKILKPKSPYAKSKLLNEQFALGKRFDVMSVVGLRLFNIYGPFQDFNSEYSAVISKWIYQIQNNYSCKIFGDGTALRDFCYVGDLCEFFYKLVNLHSVSGIFNFCTQKPITIIDLYKTLFESINNKKKKYIYTEPEYEKERKGEIQKSYGDYANIKKTFNYIPKTSIQDGIRKILGEI